ncbi:hypothetical protein SLOPH_752 [Spraguea lophii 42_110]|uniref:Uncharacterized protein n=1 Tax=Spraguea lophii (strain 42_110) TaxID=1358809 RepID=S7XUG0_SPRLO|nr:hypothetical protein SLOPH_752 [Spraguea lophii 42_110]
MFLLSFLLPKFLKTIFYIIFLCFLLYTLIIIYFQKHLKISAEIDVVDGIYTEFCINNTSYFDITLNKVKYLPNDGVNMETFEVDGKYLYEFNSVYIHSGDFIYVNLYFEPDKKLSSYDGTINLRFNFLLLYFTIPAEIKTQ